MANFISIKEAEKRISDMTNTLTTMALVVKCAEDKSTKLTSTMLKILNEEASTKITEEDLKVILTKAYDCVYDRLEFMKKSLEEVEIDDYGF